MFLVCEPIAWGLEHVSFNASLLKTIRYAYPNDTIYFHGEAAHVRHIREEIGEGFADSIMWRTLVLPPRHASFFSRVPLDFKNVRLLINRLNMHPESCVLVITGSPSLLWALKSFAGKVQNNKKIQVIFHGILAHLGHRRSSIKSFIRSLDPFFRINHIKTALKIFGHRGIHYIVLEEPIRDAVLKELPFLQNNIDVLDHPMPIDEQPVETNNYSLPIQFGFLGLTTKHKGFFKYLNLAYDISSRYPGLANFHVIGRLHKSYVGVDLPEMAVLSTKPGTERLSRDEYTQSVNQLHYVCLFHDKYYELSASGVLIDSVAKEKPIIATRLPIFENLERRFGEIGYLCTNGEFSKTIGNILGNIDSNRYNRQVLNMHRVKVSRTSESLAKQYRKLVERLQMKQVD